MNRSAHARISIPCWVAGLCLALVGSACTARAQSGAAAPVAPRAPQPPVAHGSSSTMSAWSMSTTNDDGRTIKIEGKNGAITAEVDGKPVPADRIVHEGDTVVIKDDKGETIFEGEVPGVDTSTRVYTFSGPSGGAFSASPRAMIGRGKGGITLSGPRDQVIRVPAEAPKVMIGVQLLDPDSSIRGHLGLRDDESTMVSAVYEGLAAAQAGLEPYDIIVGINGKSPAAPAAVRKALRDTDAGKSVSLDVIHRGQKKTISITVEKYDAGKLEKAKINAIAAASNTPNANAIAGAMGEDWDVLGQGANPFVGTIPGQPGQPGKAITLWRNWGGRNEDLAKHIQELVERAQVQAEHAQEQAERLREQLQSGRGAPGAGAVDLNKLMEERMKKMEEMMQKLLEHQNAAPAPKKEDGKS